MHFFFLFGTSFSHFFSLWVRIWRIVQNCSALLKKKLNFRDFLTDFVLKLTLLRNAWYFSLAGNSNCRRIRRQKQTKLRQISEQKNAMFFFGKKPIEDIFSANDLYFNKLLHHQLSATIVNFWFFMFYFSAYYIMPHKDRLEFLTLNFRHD